MIKRQQSFSCLVVQVRGCGRAAGGMLWLIVCSPALQYVATTLYCTRTLTVCTILFSCFCSAPQKHCCVSLHFFFSFQQLDWKLAGCWRQRMFTQARFGALSNFFHFFSFCVVTVLPPDCTSVALLTWILPSQCKPKLKNLARGSGSYWEMTQGRPLSVCSWPKI